ncbi:hypothetical protein ACFL4T_07890 [candidate division KSB1 bacterium]
MNKDKSIQIFHLLIFSIFIYHGNLFAQTKKEKPADKIYFNMTLDLPGKTKSSYFKGSYSVKSGDKLITKSNIFLNGLESEEERTFKTYIASLDTIDLANDGLKWTIKGSIYDSKFKETFPISSMNMSTFSKPLEGIGFLITLRENKNVYIRNIIFSDRPIKEKQN